MTLWVVGTRFHSFQERRKGNVAVFDTEHAGVKVEVVDDALLDVLKRLVVAVKQEGKQMSDETREHCQWCNNTGVTSILGTGKFGESVEESVDCFYCNRGQAPKAAIATISLTGLHEVKDLADRLKRVTAYARELEERRRMGPGGRYNADQWQAELRVKYGITDEDMRE